MIKNKYASLDKYLLVKTLGTGYNSKVKLGYNPTANHYCAVKIIKHAHPSLNMATLKKEIEILTNLKHTNVVNLIEFHESVDYVKKNGHTYKAVSIIMELVPGGELFEYVADSGRFSEEIARTYFRILIETLEFCHSQGICHRDLKPENLLFDASFNLKIADFGFATLLAGKDSSGLLHTILGTESYMAPEIHLRKPYSGESVDLFASGIILFILISGTPPFAKADPKSDPHYKLICTGKQDTFWKAHERNKPKVAGRETFYSTEFRDLLNSMLAVEPESRLTIPQIKNHAWYNGPLADIDKLRAEFMQRKKLVDAELNRQREAKKRQKMAQMSTAHGTAAYEGIKPFRSLETDMDVSLSKELQDKVNFELKRTMDDFVPEAGYKAYTEIFTVMDPEYVFKAVCAAANSKGILADFKASDEEYKIKGKANKDDGSCALNIVLTRVDESTICVEFQKKGGNITTFHKVVTEIKAKLPSLALPEDKDLKVEGEATEEPTTTTSEENPVETH